jgi:serine protease Do
MAFPIDPKRHEDIAQFLIQDPFNLRKQILPVLTVDKESGFLTGLGTSFRVDPFGTFVTSERVLKDHFETPELRDSAVATVLFGMGLIFGTVGLNSKYFVPVREAMMWRSAVPEQSPLIGKLPPPRIIADVMRFHIDDRSVPGPQEALPLPIRLLGRRPQVGDRVMAIGYPELTCVQMRSLIALCASPSECMARSAQ